MFDIGWMELVLIGIAALIVIGPKDLPRMFRTFGQYMGKARGLAREFQRTMEQAADESGLREAARDLQSVNRLDIDPGKPGRPKTEAAPAEVKATPAPTPAPPAASAAPDPMPAGTPHVKAKTAFDAAVEAAEAGKAQEAPAAGGGAPERS